LFNKGDNNHLVSLTPTYLEKTFTNKTNLKTDIENDGLVVLNPTDNSFTTDNLKYNNWNGLNLKMGWNLVSNISDKNISLSTLNSKIVWVYRDGKYFAYSDDDKISNTIKKSGFSTDKNILQPNESCWAYSEDNQIIELDFNFITSFNMNLKKGWNLVTPSSTFFELKDLKDNVIIWSYQNNEWSYFSNDGIEFSYNKLNKVLPAQGYFIYKK
jgi:hypothetical protein